MVHHISNNTRYLSLDGSGCDNKNAVLDSPLQPILSAGAESVHEWKLRFRVYSLLKIRALLMLWISAGAVVHGVFGCNASPSRRLNALSLMLTSDLTRPCTSSAWHRWVGSGWYHTSQHLACQACGHWSGHAKPSHMWIICNKCGKHSLIWPNV